MLKFWKSKTFLYCVKANGRSDIQEFYILYNRRVLFEKRTNI